MSSGSNPRDEAELEAFLVRKSSIAIDYDRLELVEPPAVLDAAILATAKFSAKPDRRAAEPATKPVPAATVTPLPARATARPVLPRPPIVETDDDEAAPPFRRPRWLVPAAVAAAVLVAVGVGAVWEAWDAMVWARRPTVVWVPMGHRWVVADADVFVRPPGQYLRETFRPAR